MAKVEVYPTSYKEAKEKGIIGELELVLDPIGGFSDDNFGMALLNLKKRYEEDDIRYVFEARERRGLPNQPPFQFIGAGYRPKNQE